MHRYLLFSFALLIGITSIHATADEISKQLRQCDKYLKANDLTSSKKGEEKTALYCYKDVLTKEAANAKALAGLKKIEDKYVGWAKKALKRGQKTKVERYLNSLRLVNPNSQALAELEAQAYPNRQHPAAPSTPPVVEATPQEPVTPATPKPPKQANITDLGQIYEEINTTECLTWPTSEAKDKGGKNGWGSFYPKKGDTGSIVGEMKHCHLEDKVYLLEINQYVVAISSTGVEIVE